MTLKEHMEIQVHRIPVLNLCPLLRVNDVGTSPPIKGLFTCKSMSVQKVALVGVYPISLL